MSVAAETPGSRIAPELVAAYRAARYEVAAGFDLAISTPSAALAAWHTGHGVSCSALITACNPASQPHSQQQNQNATRKLETALLRRKLAFSPTLALDSEGNWPAEPGFLIAGLAREAAMALGRRFGQNAIVWAGADAVPGLVLLR